MYEQNQRREQYDESYILNYDNTPSVDLLHNLPT